MKKNYGFDTTLHKLELTAESLWMEASLGEGELEVVNQGRSWISNLSFSQETGAIGQQTPRTGETEPKLVREFSAGCARHSDSTPHLFSSNQMELRDSIGALKELVAKYKREVK